MSNVAAGTKYRDWAQVDVFAERVLEGNMLAIFPDGRGLSDGEMQALARETNLSETVFILPGDDAEAEREHGVRVRIFTVKEELPFAGHPTLGTASWLRMNAPAFEGADEVRLLLNVGTIPVRFKSVDGAGVFGTMRQRDPEFGAVPDPLRLAAALGLCAGDLHPALPPRTVSTGLPFTIVPLRDVDAAGRIKVDLHAVAAALEGTGSRFTYCIAPIPGARDGAPQWHARMHMYDGEDPATGSAAGCAISYLVRNGAVGSGREIAIEQGLEIGRPSRIWVSARVEGDRVCDVFVGGRTIPVAMGRFILG